MIYFLFLFVHRKCCGSVNIFFDSSVLFNVSFTLSSSFKGFSAF